jgi:threonine/homoserine/homoserine lactone efflux protein
VTGDQLEALLRDLSRIARHIDVVLTVLLIASGVQLGVAAVTGGC